MKEMFNPVVCSVPDRLVEAARPTCRRDHIPQSDPAAGKNHQPRLVAKALQLLVKRTSEQAPELVRRVRIILSGRKRSVARQAAKDEQLGVGPGNRRQAGFDAQ
jgi:hypothetical protein